MKLLGPVHVNVRRTLIFVINTSVPILYYSVYPNYIPISFQHITGKNAVVFVNVNYTFSVLSILV